METGACSWKNLTHHPSHTKTADVQLRVVSESKITQTLMDMETFRDIHFSYFLEPTPQRSITRKSYARA